MAQCGICEQREGVREAGVCMRTAKKDCARVRPLRLRGHAEELYGIGFGAGLQLCWFVVEAGAGQPARHVCRGDCLYGLVRLVMLLAARNAAGAQAKAAVPEVDGICHGPGRYGGRPARDA